MVAAAFQFSNRLRARYLRLHRVLGYIYVTSVFISAPSPVIVAMKIPKSFSLMAANCMQSFGWLVCTAVALYCIRSGNIAMHRRWMIRSYPFAMVFTVTRTVRAVAGLLARTDRRRRGALDRQCTGSISTKCFS